MTRARTEEEFWNNCRITSSGCMEWLGKPSSEKGYCKSSFNGEIDWVHRLAFKLFHGRDPVGLVCHSCDNPSCFNPAHLFEGTYTDNQLDSIAKGRRVYETHEFYGNQYLA